MILMPRLCRGYQGNFFPLPLYSRRLHVCLLQDWPPSSISTHSSFVINSSLVPLYLLHYISTRLFKFRHTHTSGTYLWSPCISRYKLHSYCSAESWFFSQCCQSMEYYIIVTNLDIGVTSYEALGHMPLVDFNCLIFGSLQSCTNSDILLQKYTGL